MGEHFSKNPGDVKKFFLDPWPTLAGECGYDIAPETLYDLHIKQNTRQVAENQDTYNVPNSKGAEDG